MGCTLKAKTPPHPSSKNPRRAARKENPDDAEAYPNLRSRSYKSEGIILRRYALGEADRILSILTPDRGKVRAVAKGVRRPKSRLGGNLDLTNLIDFSAARGRDLDVVSEAQVKDHHPAVLSDLSRLSFALYICELADSFAPEDMAGPRLFRLVKTTLDALARAPDPWLLARWFETRLLDVSGFMPRLDDCVECAAELEPRDHLLDLSAGGALCPNCRSLGIGGKLHVSESAMRVLKHLRRSRRSEDLGAPTVREPLRREVEAVLSRYISAITEREVKSAAFTRKAGGVG